MEYAIPLELRPFLDEQGRLTAFPAKCKKKLMALEYLASKLAVGETYTEDSLGDLLDRWHTFHDPATLRRELYNNRFLDRSPDGRAYWATPGEGQV